VPRERPLRCHGVARGNVEASCLCWWVPPLDGRPRHCATSRSPLTGLRGVFLCTDFYREVVPTGLPADRSTSSVDVNQNGGLDAAGGRSEKLGRWSENRRPCPKVYPVSSSVSGLRVRAPCQGSVSGLRVRAPCQGSVSGLRVRAPCQGSVHWQARRANLSIAPWHRRCTCSPVGTTSVSGKGVRY
jgi:hypothetical protein